MARKSTFPPVPSFSRKGSSSGTRRGLSVAGDPTATLKAAGGKSKFILSFEKCSDIISKNIVVCKKRAPMLAAISIGSRPEKNTEVKKGLWEGITVTNNTIWYGPMEARVGEDVASSPPARLHPRLHCLPPVDPPAAVPPTTHPCLVRPPALPSTGLSLPRTSGSAERLHRDGCGYDGGVAIVVSGPEEGAVS